MKKRIMILLVSVVMLLAFGGMAEATVATKQVQVNYNNIKIYSNGKVVSLSAGQEPFLLNGVTYVPLRVAGQALNSSVDWQAETKSIQITSGATNTTEVINLKIQITQKDQEIANLKKQIETLQNQPNNNKDKDKDDTDGDLNDLEDDLLDKFDELENIPIEDIKLDGDEDSVDVEIEVDLKDYDDEWEDLSDSDIEDWIKDVVEYIQDELSEDTEVDGVIINIDDDEELVDLYKDGDDDLKVDFNDDDYRGDSNYDDVKDNLLDESYDVDNLKFTVSSVDYDKDDDYVTVNLDAKDSDCSEQWGELDDSDIEDDVTGICEDIADKFDEEDITIETVQARFYDEDDDQLDSFKYDVDSDSLD